MIDIRKYEQSDKVAWNTFITTAKNATFLFQRDFMEYHKDRFEDYSLMCYKNKKLIAVLPANIDKNIVYSHQGLTYGGLVVQQQIKFEDYLNVFEQLLAYLFNNDIEHLMLKQLPNIYTNYPSEEFTYLQFLLNAESIRKDLSSTIKLSDRLSFSRGRLEGVKRGDKSELKVLEVNEFDQFWNEILIPTLQNKHEVKPVHSLEEIRLLKSKFPNNIRQFNVYCKDRIVAGTTVFVTDKVAHSQYIAANEEKSVLGSLDFLHQYLIADVFKDKAYFDFGISNENNGKQINKGLLFWKEGFGARAIAYEFFKIPTANYKKLKNVFI